MCYLLVTGTFSCVLKVSDRFSEYKKTPKIQDFRGLLLFFDIRLNYLFVNVLIS